MQQRPHWEMKFIHLLKIFSATYEFPSFAQELIVWSPPGSNASSPLSSTLFLYDSCQYYPPIYTYGRRGNVVGIVAGLWAEWSRVQILEEARNFSLL
jgi:hypothetical protein